MNLKQLEYFVAIAEERQITAAARRLDARGPGFKALTQADL